MQQWSDISNFKQKQKRQPKKKKNPAQFGKGLCLWVGSRRKQFPSIFHQSFCILPSVSLIRCFIISPTERACAVTSCCRGLWFAKMRLMCCPWDFWGWLDLREEGILSQGLEKEKGKKKKKSHLPCRDDRTHSSLISGSLTSAVLGEPSANFKPGAGSSDTLSSPNTSLSSVPVFISSCLCSCGPEEEKLWALSIICQSLRPLRPWKFPYLRILLSLPLCVSSPFSTTFSSLESSVCASGPLSFYSVLRAHSGIIF